METIWLANVYCPNLSVCQRTSLLSLSDCVHITTIGSLAHHMISLWRLRLGKKIHFDTLDRNIAQITNCIRLLKTRIQLMNVSFLKDVSVINLKCFSAVVVKQI